MMKLLFFSVLILTVACNTHVISKKTIVSSQEYQGKKRAWIHAIKIIDDDSYTVRGGFVGELNIGDTTIVGEGYNHFLIFFKNDKPVKALLTDGIKILDTDNNKNYFVVGNIDFTTAFIRYYDSNFNLTWQKTFGLKNIKRNISQITFLDLKIDKANNFYGLLNYEEGEFEIEGKHFNGNGDVLIKLSNGGKLDFIEKISEPRSFNRLTLENGVVYATSKKSFSGYNCNTSERIIDDKRVNESSTSDIISNGYFKLTTNNSRPEKYVVVKYDSSGEQVLKAQVFESNAQERTGEIIDLDKKKFLFINTNHEAQPAQNGLSNYRVNFFTMDKKRLRTLKSWSLNCSNIHKDILFTKHGKFIYIGFTYFKNAKFDNLGLPNDGETPLNESFAILKYKVN